MADPWIKRFQFSIFIACGRLILCISIKEMSDPGIKRFNIRNLWLPRAHIMCFNEGNVRSWNKKVSAFEIFRLRRAHTMCLINKMSDHGIKRFQHLKFFIINDKCEWGAAKRRRASYVTENPNRNFFWKNPATRIKNCTYGKKSTTAAARPVKLTLSRSTIVQQMLSKSKKHKTVFLSADRRETEAEGNFCWIEEKSCPGT